MINVDDTNKFFNYKKKNMFISLEHKKKIGTKHNQNNQYLYYYVVQIIYINNKWKNYNTLNLTLIKKQYKRGYNKI